MFLIIQHIHQQQILNIRENRCDRIYLNISNSIAYNIITFDIVYNIYGEIFNNKDSQNI